MGCGSSRSSAVKRLDSSKPPSGSKPWKPRSADHALIGRKKKRPETGTSAASVSKIALRSSSATSNKSADSGIGSEPRLTPESSAVSALSAKLKQTQARSPFETSIGRSDPEPAPRIDSDKILSSLRNEGLVGRPQTSTSKGGVSYEVPLGELQPAKKKPPPRLQKLERQNELDLTKQRIREKLERAERRRKRRAQEKIERSREKDAKNLEVKLALLEIEKNKEKELRNQVDLNLHSHLTRKASQVEQIIEKQRIREQKVEDVQKRKLLSPRPMLASPEELRVMAPKPSPRNIDEIPVAAARSK